MWQSALECSRVMSSLSRSRAAKKINEEAQAANQGGRALPMHIDLASLK
jgi:hypothetical protein